MLVFMLATGTVLFFSCICSLLEAALYSLPASQIEILARENQASGKILKKLHKDIQSPISAILTLNTLANTGGAAIAGAAFVGVFPNTQEVYFTIAISFSVLVFSEIIPKTAGVVYARVFAPFIWLNRLITNLITRGAQVEQGIAPEEIEIIARMSRQAGSISRAQERVISNILNLETLRARNIMTPRTVVFSLDRNLSLSEARQQAGSWPHTRVPLYDAEKENIVSLALRRDVFLAMADGGEEMRLADVERSVHVVPESARASQLLQEYIKRREHLFIVVDEYGVFSGIITLEDVIEEIVGQEIVGEFDLAVDMREQARRHGEWFKDV
jgi:CBS domain containing-hemolysin-like protein